MKVYIKKSVWEGFISRAKKKYPKEYIEAIWGTETIEGFRISKFAKVEHTGTKKSIYHDDFDIKSQDWLARQEGLNYLGTVHTHPHITYDSCPSTTDHKESFRLGDRIMGIVVLYKKNGRFKIEHDWWFPQPSLKFIILDE